MVQRRESPPRYAPFVPDEPETRVLARIAVGYPPFLALLGFVSFWIYLIFFARHLRNFGAEGDPHDLPLALHSIAYFLLFGMTYNLLVSPLVHWTVKLYKPQCAVKDSYVWLIWISSVFMFFAFFPNVLWLLD